MFITLVMKIYQWKNLINRFKEIYKTQSEKFYNVMNKT